MLDKLRKRICRAIGSSIAAYLPSLTYPLFYSYYFVGYSSELVQLVPLAYSGRRSTPCFDRLHNFSVTIPAFYKDVYDSFFPRKARLWNFLPIECIPLTYDLNGFPFRINRYLLCLGKKITILKF